MQKIYFWSTILLIFYWFYTSIKSSNWNVIKKRTTAKVVPLKEIAPATLLRFVICQQYHTEGKYKSLKLNNFNSSDITHVSGKIKTIL